VNRRLGLAAAALLCFACRSDPPLPEPTSQRDHRTANVLLVADNQYHELYGAPTFLQSAHADRTVEVALRPAQQRLYGDELFAWVLARGAPAAELIVHLGDAMDVSCLSEWQRFERTMALAGKPWLMVPGNHDGFFTGNLSPAVGDTSVLFADAYGNTGWCLRCSDGYPQCVDDPAADPRVVDKNAFIRRYLRHLGIDLAAATGSGEQSLALGSLPVRVAWKIDREAPWRSFVIQQVHLPSDCAEPANCDPVVLFLIDTNQPQKRPKFPFRPLGLAGAVGDDQVEILRRWASAVAGTTGAFALAGHHPLDTVKAGKDALEALLEASETPLYISAHTHADYWKVHGRGDEAIAELNVGSVLDWPPEWRPPRIERPAGDPPPFESERFALGPVLENEPAPGRASVVCDGDWRIHPDDPISVSNQQPDLRLDQYAGIIGTGNQVERARETMRSALRAELLQLRHEHLQLASHADDIAAIEAQIARLAPTEPLDNMTRVAPQSLLRRLRDEEDWRTTPDALRRYRVCQALWAAEADHERQSESIFKRMKDRKGQIDPRIEVCVLPDCD